MRRSAGILSENPCMIRAIGPEGRPWSFLLAQNLSFNVAQGRQARMRFSISIAHIDESKS